MHTIITDYGRSIKEITDVEWDIRMVSARGERHWTYGAAWGDHLASTHRMRNDMLGQPMSRIRMTQYGDARAEYSAVANQEHEMELRGRCPHP